MKQRIVGITAVAACLSGTLLTVSTLRAFLIASQPTPVAPLLGPVREPVPYATNTVDIHTFAAAVEANPFHPQRQRGAAFTLPSEQMDSHVEEVTVVDEVHTVQLIGTGQKPAGRDFVVCQYDAEQPRLVEVGGFCGDRALLRVGRGQAEFRDVEGRTEVLSLPGREQQ